MLTLIVSFLAGLVVATLLRVTNLVHTIPGAILPGLLAVAVMAIFLMRRLSKRIEPLVAEATRHMQAGRREMALKSLRSGLWLRRWHPLIEGQLRTQIGVLEYAQGNYDEAVSELRRGSKRPWEGPAFLGAAYFKQRNEAAMTKAFEQAVKASPKESLAWSVYAWCLTARGEKDKAAAILKRGIEKLPSDQRLSNNLELVQTGKKMKMAPYGDQWAIFSLDGTTPGTSNLPPQARGYNPRPGFRQRPQRKR